MPPLDGEQLADEAGALKEELTGEGAAAGAGQGDKVPEGESPQHGATGGAPGEGGSQPDDFHQEHIPNPAPQLKAALIMARDFPLLARFVPKHVRVALSDENIAELSDSFGDLAVKHGWNIIPGLDEWKEELRVVMALAVVSVAAVQAAQADPDAARAEAARDVTPPRGDPPNPAAGMPPVEPGVGPVS